MLIFSVGQATEKLALPHILVIEMQTGTIVTEGNLTISNKLTYAFLRQAIQLLGIYPDAIPPQNKAYTRLFIIYYF